LNCFWSASTIFLRGWSVGLLFDRVVSARSGFDVNVSSSFFVDLRADKGDARVVDADFVVVWISVFF